MAERLTIERLGSAGDGVAEGPSGPVFVPYGLPGEAVSVERSGERAALLAVEEPSPERIAPFCPYFGRCGGCVAQHMAGPLYSGWKRAKLVDALARVALDTPVEPLRDAHGEGRRRLTFHVRLEDGRARAGFMAARSHTLVPIESCPVAVPALSRAPHVAATLGARLLPLGKPLDIVVTATLAGLDVDIRGAGRGAEAHRQALIRLALGLDLARLSLHGDTLIETRPPAIVVGRATAIPPPGGFLQATSAGEVALAAAVVAAIGDRAKRVADLFAGIGPFTLRLAERAEVHAVESDPAMLASLDRTARGTPGLRRITTERRDLFRRPLLASELERFDAVVLDPPRAGAEAQVAELGRWSGGSVAMVSCDPGTFARDAATLAAAGFALVRAVPIDQFAWSAHVEIVGVFSRPVRRPRRRGRLPPG